MLHLFLKKIISFPSTVTASREKFGSHFISSVFCCFVFFPFKKRKQMTIISFSITKNVSLVKWLTIQSLNPQCVVSWQCVRCSVDELVLWIHKSGGIPWVRQTQRVTELMCCHREQIVSWSAIHINTINDN